MDLLLSHGAVLFDCVPEFYTDSNLVNIYLWKLWKTLEGSRKLSYLSHAAIRILLSVLQQEKVLYHKSNQTHLVNSFFRNIAVLGLKSPQKATGSDYCTVFEMMCNYVSHSLYHSSLNAVLEMLKLVPLTETQIKKKDIVGEDPAMQQHLLISTLATSPRSLQKLSRN